MRRAITKSLVSKGKKHWEAGSPSQFIVHNNLWKSTHFPRHYGSTSLLHSIWSIIPSGFMSASTSPSQSNEDYEKVPHPSDIHMPQPRNTFARQRDCEKEIAELLHCPNGAIMKAATWVKADACTQDAVDNEDFVLAFEFLDRMARDPNAVKEMNADIVYNVIHAWLLAYTKISKSPRSNQNNLHTIHSPINVWRRIESYLERGIRVESRTLHRLLESTAIIRSKKSNGPILAEAILEKMFSLSKFQHPDIRPSTYTFNTVLASWMEATMASSKSHSVLEEAPERATKLLEQLKGLYAAGWGVELMPDRQTYRRVMNIHAIKGDGDRVEALLQEQYEMFLEHGHSHLIPTVNMFFLVLFAWSKSTDPTAAERATTILEHMLELEANNVLPGFKVTPFCFNIVMLCWSRQRTREATEKLQQIFDQMVTLSAKDPSKRPIPGSYASLIFAWSFHDPKKAEEVFWTWKGEKNAGRCEMRIDSKLFSTLISGWFHSSEVDAAVRCDKLLQYALDGNLGDGWEPHPPDFNMVIHAYCRRNNIEEIERAEAILNQMNDLKNSSDAFPGPSMTSYIPVINALTRVNKVDRADTLLQQCFDRKLGHMDHPSTMNTGRSQGCKKKQNTKTFNRVLKGWLSNCRISPEAAQRAEDLLTKMEGWDVNPNLASFQYVLDCRRKCRELHGAGERSSQMERAAKIVALLDREHANGALYTEKSSYLYLRREWALEAL